MRLRKIVLAGSVVLLAGSADKPVDRTLSFNDGQTYRSPSGKFTCLVPILLRPGDRQTERTLGGTTVVSFADRFGTLQRIEATTPPPDAYDRMTGPDARVSLGVFFDDRVVADLQKNFPGTRAVVRDYPYTAVGHAFFGTVVVPGGSTLNDPTDPARRLDALRGYLLFPKNGSLFIVTNQELPPSTGRDEGLSDQDRADRLLGNLKTIVGGMTFP